MQINTATDSCSPAAGFTNAIDNVLLNKWECPTSSPIDFLQIVAQTYQDIAFDMIVILSADYCADKAIEIYQYGTEDL